MEFLVFDRDSHEMVDYMVFETKEDLDEFEKQNPDKYLIDADDEEDELLDDWLDD